MSSDRKGRLVFALVVLVALLVIGRNVYRRYQEKSLADAVKAGDDDAASALLKQGVFAGDMKKLESLLHAAILQNEPNTVHVLLQQGVNPNGVPDAVATPLIEAARHCPSAVIMLLDKGANIDTSYRVTTALREAIVSSHLDAARLLLERGASVNLKDQQKITPLRWAALFDNKEAAILLLTYGARLDADLPGETALEVAARSRHIALLPLLLSAHPSPTLKNRALGAAVEVGSVDATRLLLAAGARPSPQSPEWLQAVYTAHQQSKHGKREYADVLALLSPFGVTATTTKAEIETPDVFGQTVLAAALAKGDKAEAQSLLALGANVNVAVKQDREGRQGRTPLLEAVEHCLDMVAPLLAKKANPNCIATNGETPLNKAVMASNLAVVRLLLEHGADANQYKPRLHTPLYYARRHHLTDIVTALQQAGGKER